MYTKQELINKFISKSKENVDFDIIYSSFSSQEIKPSLIDEKNIEYFDEEAFEMLKQIISKEKEDKQALTIDNKSLNFFAELISKKVSNEILEQIIESAKLKRDNELLSIQLKNIIEENSLLISKIKKNEDETAKYKQIYGFIYIKTP
jgi:hypothetical protein